MGHTGKPIWVSQDIADGELYVLGQQNHLWQRMYKRIPVKKLTGKEVEVMAIHAGLECGLIGEKYAGMDMISFGPDLRNPHSPDEKVHIESVGRFWTLLLETLKVLA